MKKLILSILFIFFAWSAWGATYYVRASGTNADADCSESSACCAGAMDVSDHNGASFSDNDIIYLCDDDGDLTTMVTPPSSGSVAGVITYNGRPTGQSTNTVIDVATNRGFYLNNKDYITVQNLTLAGSAISNFYAITGSDNVTLDAVTMSGGTRYGLIVEDCDELTIKNSYIINNYETGALVHDTTNFTMYDSVVSGNGIDDDSNFDGMEIDGCADYLVYNTTFSSNKGDAGNAGLDINPSATPVDASGTVRDCTFTDNDIVGLMIKGGGTHNVHNNLMFRNGDYEFYFGDTADEGIVNLFNNTLFSDSATNIIRMYDVSDAGATLNIKNNILYGSCTYGIYYDGDDSTIASGYNDFYFTGETAFAYARDGDNAITFAQWVTAHEGGSKTSLDEDTDPLFRSSTNFRLKSNSPAIDAGELISIFEDGWKDVYGTSRLCGDAPDIGAAEYCKGMSIVLFPLIPGSKTADFYVASDYEHYLLIDGSSHYLLIDGAGHKLRIDGAE